MMMKFHSCRAGVLDGTAVPLQRDACSMSQSRPEVEWLLRDSLMMFLDLGLNPDEMSRVSGFSPRVIEDGLARVGKIDD